MAFLKSSNSKITFSILIVTLILACIPFSQSTQGGSCLSDEDCSNGHVCRVSYECSGVHCRAANGICFQSPSLLETQGNDDDNKIFVKPEGQKTIDKVLNIVNVPESKQIDLDTAKEGALEKSIDKGLNQATPASTNTTKTQKTPSPSAPPAQSSVASASTGAPAPAPPKKEDSLPPLPDGLQPSSSTGSSSLAAASSTGTASLATQVDQVAAQSSVSGPPVPRYITDEELLDNLHELDVGTLKLNGLESIAPELILGHEDHSYTMTIDPKGQFAILYDKIPLLLLNDMGLEAVSLRTQAIYTHDLNIAGTPQWRLWSEDIFRPADRQKLQEQLNKLKSLDLDKSAKQDAEDQIKLAEKDLIQKERKGWSGEDMWHCGGAFVFLAPPTGLNKTFINLPPHTQVRVTATAHFIDDWQGETAWASIDDQLVWTDSVDQRNTGKKIDICGSKQYPEPKFAVPIDISFSSSEPQFSISFGSNLDVNSEARFGVSQVSIHLRTQRESELQELERIQNERRRAREEAARLKSEEQAQREAEEAARLAAEAEAKNSFF